MTSWISHCVQTPADVQTLEFSHDNVYFRKIEELTQAALARCAGRFMVGYTDLHGSLDCVADWRDPQELCYDIVDDPAMVHQMLKVANRNFLPVYDRFDATLGRHGAVP